MKINKQARSIILKRGTIIDPYRKTTSEGDVLIENGKIADIGEINDYGGAEVLDCHGLVITHGLCDLHAHFREPGREDKETLATGTRAALAGGFTRVCVMPNTNPPLDTPESIRFIVEKAADLAIYIHPIGAITKGQKGLEITEIGAMKSEGAVAFSDDGIPLANGQVLRLAMEYAGMFNVPVINHAEDPDIRNDGVMHEGAVSTKLGLAGNPAVAESSMVQRDLELAMMTGTRLHIPHVSSSLTIKHLERMQTPKITAEVTPHHLYFNHHALTSFNTNLKVAPPLRTEEDRNALINAIKAGTISCIATDHAPHAIEEKEATFDLAPFGMIGLESCFGVVNKILVRNSELSLMHLLTMLTVNPRKIMGFETDLLNKGKEAELAVFDTETEWTFSVSDIYSRSKNSPFVGETLLGKPRYVIVKGMLVEI